MIFERHRRRNTHYFLFFSNTSSSALLLQVELLTVCLCVCAKVSCLLWAGCTFFLYSILDVVAYNCFLEVVPAVIGVLRVAHLCVGHAAHGADVRLDALLLVVGNGHRRQVDCQVFFEHVVKLDVLLKLGSSGLFGDGVLLLGSFTLEHGAERELAGVQFVDGVGQRYYLALAITLASINCVFLADSLAEGLQAPDLAFDPVVDMNERVGVLLGHKLEFVLQCRIVVASD